jgi:hypothetical protein
LNALNFIYVAVSPSVAVSAFLAQPRDALQRVSHAVDGLELEVIQAPTLFQPQQRLQQASPHAPHVRPLLPRGRGEGAGERTAGAGAVQLSAQARSLLLLLLLLLL